MVFDTVDHVIKLTQRDVIDPLHYLLALNASVLSATAAKNSNILFFINS